VRVCVCGLCKRELTHNATAKALEDGDCTLADLACAHNADRLLVPSEGLVTQTCTRKNTVESPKTAHAQAED
jgi:hypothetical protein